MVAEPIRSRRETAVVGRLLAVREFTRQRFELGGRELGAFLVQDVAHGAELRCNGDRWELSVTNNPLPEPDAALMTPSQLRALLIVPCAGLALVAAGKSALALPNIADDLGADQSELTWIIDAYTLTFAALLTAGIAADRIGRRTIPVVGLGIFGFVAFGIHQLRAKTSSLDVGLFANRGLAAGAIIVTIQFFAALGFFVLSPCTCTPCPGTPRWGQHWPWQGCRSRPVTRLNEG